ncbi:NAD(P)/FAD-dependent oxidoreductase [Micromonospora sp. NPDC126480]|uniref:flavin-containing monooxygenase n=1 Tax=Micromonospora sp. NPDC126480 TaxID=3155312 RepID=UPI0033297BDF
MKTSTEPVVIVGGGQSGLAAAQAARSLGLRPVILHAGATPVGSWPDYYDSLTLFSPARYSTLPGMPFDGDPDRYPARDEVIAYLSRYAAALDVDIRTGVRVTAVEAYAGGGFLVRTGTGKEILAGAVVAASGSFGNPYVPDLPGRAAFAGDLRHVAGYRRPDAYAGKRVIVVGAGNSAVQVALELAAHAQVTLATREPVRFLPQRVRGRDLHEWLHRTGLDRLPSAVVTRLVRHAAVLDAGEYRRALASGRISRREMFTAFTAEGVVGRDGSVEPADAVIFATGYRPDLAYLDPLGALTRGLPRQVGGLSRARPGLAHLGLEFQRSFASNTLRGVGRDAAHVVRALAAHLAGRRWPVPVAPPAPGGGPGERSARDSARLPRNR